MDSHDDGPLTLLFDFVFATQISLLVKEEFHISLRSLPPIRNRSITWKYFPPRLIAHFCLSNDDVIGACREVDLRRQDRSS